MIVVRHNFGMAIHGVVMNLAFGEYPIHPGLPTSQILPTTALGPDTDLPVPDQEKIRGVRDHAVLAIAGRIGERRGQRARQPSGPHACPTMFAEKFIS